MAAGKRMNLRYLLRPYLTREPVLLAALTVLAIVLFTAVGVLSRTFHAQEESLGKRWFSRGVTDLNGRRFDAAVSEFRAALRYSRDDYSYQLNLAEALVGLQRTGEAEAYFVNLWDRQPEDGLVNLELARITAQRHQTQRALRYYHNAIYATWPGDQEIERRNTRLELIDFLLKINSKAQAQAETIALAANVGDDPAEQARVGDLFLHTQDYEHALAAYRLSLKSDRHNQDALAGAGTAAFELGRYDVAERYLQAAVAADANDAKSAATLKTTELTLQMDPFRRGISVAQRDRIVVAAFENAGERLKACGLADGTAAPGNPKSDLRENWTKMKPRITTVGLRRDPDLVESAMDLVFSVERQTSPICSAPTGADMALLLISKLHEGN
jgi:tetratricopeptide (TPR) repeat protein